MVKKEDEAYPKNDDSAEESKGEIAREDIDKAISDAESDMVNGDGGDKASDSGEGSYSSKAEIESEEESIESLLAELERVRIEARENNDKYLRAAAELENFKKRIMKEKAESHRYANEDIIKGLLPVVDNLERALSHGEDGSNADAIIEGVGMVLKQFIDVLEKFGVRPIEALGKSFDPNYHEAIMRIETDESPPNTVVNEISKGYLLHDRLIRPSVVGVSMGQNSTSTDGEVKQEEEKFAQDPNLDDRRQKKDE